MIKIGYVTIDSHDPHLIAKFWADLLNWKITESFELGAMLENPDNETSDQKFLPILFYKNPDEKVVKNRIHFDLQPDNQELEVARIEKLGGKRIEIGQSLDPNTTWVVMADPEGNEFCVLKSA